jgi:hypothetical protein
MAAVCAVGGGVASVLGVRGIARCPGVPGLVVIVCGSACSGFGMSRRRQSCVHHWCGPVRVRVRVGRCDAGVGGEVGVGEVGAGALVEPGFEDVEVAGGDQEGDEEVLGDLAGCGAVFGVADVDLVALEPAVDPFVVGPDGFVGGDPGGGEVGDVLPELGGLEVAGGVGGDGDGRFAADRGQLIGGGFVGGGGRGARSSPRGTVRRRGSAAGSSRGRPVPPWS